MDGQTKPRPSAGLLSEDCKTAHNRRKLWEGCRSGGLVSLTYTAIRRIDGTHYPKAPTGKHL